MTGTAPDEKPARHRPDNHPANVGEAIADADLVTSPVRVQYPTDWQSAFLISDHLVRLIGTIIVHDEALHSVPVEFSIAENPRSVFHHQRVTSVFHLQIGNGDTEMTGRNEGVCALMGGSSSRSVTNTQ